MKNLIVTLLFFAHVFLCNAQIKFEEVLNAPFDGVNSGSIAFADIDRDGNQDVLITGSETSKLYKNDGDGNFTEVVDTPFEGVSASSVAFADVDGDGDQDVLIIGMMSSKLYKNDGNGNFTEAISSFTELFNEEFEDIEGIRYGSIAFADVDGDGDLDVLITGGVATLFFARVPISKLYLNDGNGNFSEDTEASFVRVWYSSVAFADVNGNGYQDVMITGRTNMDDELEEPYNVTAKLYLNDGNGKFTEDTETLFEGVGYSSIAFADLDVDGDQDVLITGYSNEFVNLAKLYINDGNGKFTEDTETPFEGVRFSYIAFADVDIDGDQDVLITGESNEGRIAKLYSNDGSGNFNVVTGTTFDGTRFSSFAFADVDGDQRQDVLITGSNSSNNNIAKLYRNLTSISTDVSSVGALEQLISLYPNPSAGDFKLENNTNAPLTISITDALGKNVYQQEAGTGQTSINASLSKGVYMVRLQQNGNSVTKKMVVQ